MSFRRALLLAIAVHAITLLVPLPVRHRDVAPEGPRVRDLDLRLVQPTQTLGTETDSTGAAMSGDPTGGLPRGGRQSRAAGGAASDAPATGGSGGGEARPDAAGETAVATPESGASSLPAGRAAHVSAPEPTFAELEAELGLDLEAIGDQLENRIFPVMLKIHLQGGRPTASSYRQLLRTYIDVLMGYPWAVQDRLAANSDVRFLAQLEVTVEADGSFAVEQILMNESLADADGRMEAFYRRLLEEVTERPFLPPSRAGLPSPAHLTFQLLNPEARIR